MKWIFSPQLTFQEMASQIHSKVHLVDDALLLGLTSLSSERQKQDNPCVPHVPAVTTAIALLPMRPLFGS